jgi:hypothetical protein
VQKVRAVLRPEHWPNTSRATEKSSCRNRTTMPSRLQSSPRRAF